LIRRSLGLEERFVHLQTIVDRVDDVVRQLPRRTVSNHRRIARNGDCTTRGVEDQIFAVDLANGKDPRFDAESDGIVSPHREDHRIGQPVDCYDRHLTQALRLG